MTAINNHGVLKGLPGVKYDSGKPLAAVLMDFSRALQQVVDVGTYGANKYTRLGWASVADGEVRYMDALWRHLLLIEPEGVDQEMGIKHLAAVAWNALAVLELQARQTEACSE